MVPALRAGLLAVLCVALCWCLASVAVAHAETEAKGRVTDEYGAPLRASVAQIVGSTESDPVTADADGRFDLTLVQGATYLLVYYDDMSTPGFDYLPSIIGVGGGDLAAVVLRPAATMAFVGSPQFVDTENLPTSVTLNVTDTGGGLLNQTGFPLSFRFSSGGGTQLPGLAAYSVVAPADTRFRVSLEVSVLVGSKMEERVLDTGELGPLPKGTLLSVDLGKFSIPYGFHYVEGLASGLKPLMDEMEGRGFYLVRERGAAAHGEAELASARSLLVEGRLTESFDLLKTSYLDLRGVRLDLEELQADAAGSVYVLVGFFALASVVAGFVVANGLKTQVPASALFNFGSVLALYAFYPGSKAISTGSFASVTAVLFLASLAAGVLLPRVLEGLGGGDRVGLLDVLVPVMGMAKRNLRRRRLRLLLTLISLMVMVMGFVSLTSFAGGYGLVSERVSGAPAGAPRVLIRSGSWSEGDPAFLSAGGTEVKWLGFQEGVSFTAAKLETVPAYTSPVSASGRRLMGIVGVDASLEPRATAILGALAEGGLPGQGGVALSTRLAEELGVRLGDQVTLGSTELTLQGVFDDARLYALADIDGRRFLPEKWVNTSPKSEPPVYVLEECEAGEVAIVDASMAARIPLAGLSRITVGLDNVDPVAFARRMALERGHQAWAAGPEGVWLEKVGSYLDAKGLPLVVPWAIVALNVVVTTLSSLYERRREIGILSSVGLNPAEISAVFVSEAGVTAFVAGGLGYLAGLGLYRAMPVLGLALEVQQKVSAAWCLAAVGLSVSAVLVGAFAALRGSLVVTPSLTRRWKVGDAKDSMRSLYEVPVPLRLAEGEVESFTAYLAAHLRGMEDDPVKRTARVKEERDGEAATVSFIYRSSQNTTVSLYTKNRVIVERSDDGGYQIRLESVGESAWVQEAGGLVRLIAMEWSGRKRGGPSGR